MASAAAATDASAAVDIEDEDQKRRRRKRRSLRRESKIMGQIDIEIESNSSRGLTTTVFIDTINEQKLRRRGGDVRELLRGARVADENRAGVSVTAESGV